MDFVRGGPSDLNDEKSSGSQQAPGVGNQAANHIQAIPAAEKRYARFPVADFLLDIFARAFGNVGRVREHQVEHIRFESRSEIAHDESNLCLEPSGILRGETHQFYAYMAFKR